MLPLALPAGLALLLAAFLFAPTARAIPGLFWSFVLAPAGLLAWTAWLYARLRRQAERPDNAGNRPAGSDARPSAGLTLDFALRLPHWVQTLAQGAIFLWWGWYVRPVYEFAPFILAQLILAVAVESLFAFTRQGRYTLGFGPIPVVFSLNLFLWFHLPWFFFQMAMVVLTYAGKEFVQWRLRGRRRHIFNPSAFALAVVAVALIVTGRTEQLTQGIEIAQSQYVPPHIFLVIFLAALPAQLLFGVVTMTLPAVLVMYGFSAAYHAATGIYYFYDAYIPIAVFLGLHLLFTDPATSPRSELGRVCFGIVYGSGVVVGAFLLNAVGAPPFYDKILPVPILNALAPRLDRWAEWLAARLRVAWAAKPGPVPLPRRFATVGAWAAVFAALSAAGGIGDEHPGQYYPFWQKACDQGSERACDYLGIKQWKFCDQGSGWACNEFGLFLIEKDGDYRGAEGEFERACGQGYGPGCTNLSRVLHGETDLANYVRDAPSIGELPLVLRGSKGPVEERDVQALFLLACERGWAYWGCEGWPSPGAGAGQAVPQDGSPEPR